VLHLLFEIEPGGEIAACALDDEDAEFVVAFHCIEGILQLVKHPPVDSVQSLRPLQNEVRNGSRPLKANGLIRYAHAYPRNGWSTSGIGSRPRPGLIGTLTLPCFGTVASP